MRTTIENTRLRTATAVLLGSTVILTGCVFHHGTRVEEANAPFAAAGAGVDIRLSTGLSPDRVGGELLEVGDSAVLILNDDVWLLTRRQITSIRLREQSLRARAPAIRQSNDRVPDELRLLARFPWGMPDGVLEQILTDRRQTALRRPATSTAGSQQQPEHRHEPQSLSIDSFLRDARAATVRYRRRAAAIADGYRRLGPSFPGMGEHWVHPGLIVSGSVDQRRPPVLCYIDSAGTPTLVGLAFTVPLRAGEGPPESPMGANIWHQHGDEVDAETLLLVHGAPVDDAAPRLAMFHAWTWLDNPDGVFAQNNWALPFAQLGFDVPTPTAAAAQALALRTAGADFYLRIFDRLVPAQPDQRRIMQTELVTATARVDAWRASRTSTTLLADDVQALEEIWSDLWLSIDQGVDDRTRIRLLEYPGRAEPSESGR
jgi:hypothetical protein